MGGGMEVDVGESGRGGELWLRFLGFASTTTRSGSTQSIAITIVLQSHRHRIASPSPQRTHQNHSSHRVSVASPNFGRTWYHNAGLGCSVPSAKSAEHLIPAVPMTPSRCAGTITTTSAIATTTSWVSGTGIPRRTPR